MNERPLGRRRSLDDQHVQRYSLTAATMPTRPTPVVLGVNWYSAFDSPEKFEGRYWVARNGDLGRLRGGHSVCLKPTTLIDPLSWWDFYNQGQEGACFPAGTRIQKADGTWRSIEDLNLLDQLRTAEGNVGFVTNKSVRWNKDGLYHVRLRGHIGVKSTGEHPFLTKRGYVKASELVIGDEVALTRVVEYDTVNEVNLGRFVSRKANRTQQNGTRQLGSGNTTVLVETIVVPETIKLTPELGELFGLYLAEGCTSEQRVVWCFGGHEKDTLVQRTVELLKTCFDLNAHVQHRKSGSINVVVYGKAWREVFEGLFNTGSGQKTIPFELIMSNNDVKKAVLEGWLAGDGHRRRTQVAGVTISHDLALGMYSIANDLGLFPTINCSPPSMNKHAATRQDRWDVTIPEGDGPRPEMTETAVWRRVSEITQEEKQGWVYNLSVSGDESYVAEGLGVHNCVGFASSRAMSLLNRKRYDARWLYQQAQLIDDWDDTPPEEGTSVRAAMDILREIGHTVTRKPAPNALEGIAENRWTRSVNEVIECLGGGRTIERLEAVPFLNSWGRSYPHITWLPAEVLQRLLNEQGEATIITDRG